GTLDQKKVELFLNELKDGNDALKVVTYKQIDSRTFDTELVNAIAEGRSPDLVILPSSLLVSYRTKLQALSAETLDPRVFRDTYVDGAEVFLMSDGTYGLPFAVDPLVMYWNRDLFSSGGLATPPSTWESLVTETVPALVRTDPDLNITQSAIAFGEYANVEHAKDVLTMLLMQAGTTIVTESDGRYEVTLLRKNASALSPGEAALTFYTQFVVPGKDLYSWNRAKRLDRDMFLAGDLALYFGLGSERSELEAENSNLNFDVAMVPEGEGATVKRTSGEFYAFVLPRASKNLQGAYALAKYLGNAENGPALADAFGFAPAHRTAYAGSVSDPFKQVVYQSALIARAWLDPSPSGSADVFERMVEDYTSGRARLSAVLSDAASELQALFK
ncbi:MAG TPA: extracellular solute-binding protein, partial [Candidatus Paceibacterota bacterium]|nr:extracellular solute-binding protein [Candidatus Paceibacterota bacterium]